MLRILFSSCVSCVAPGTQGADTAAEILVTDPSAGAGNRLDLTWAASAVDHEWQLFRARAEAPEALTLLATLPPGASQYTDDDVAANRPYLYVLRPLDGSSAQQLRSPVASSLGLWFRPDSALVLAGISALLAGIACYVPWRRRRDPPHLRPLGGLTAVEEALGRATEMGRPVLYTSGVGDVRAPGVLASIGILSWVAEEAARHGVRLLYPVNNALNLAIGQQVVRDAFLRAGRLEAYRDDTVHFLSARQFDYAAAVCGLMERERTAAHFFFGSFWSETLILTETGAATGALQIAATDSESQVPFFVATCDHVLMGEELYAASAYLTGDRDALAILQVQDLFKGALLSLMILYWVWLHAGASGA